MPALEVHNGQAFTAAKLDLLPIDAFRQEVLARVAGGGRLALLCGLPGESAVPRLVAAVAQVESGNLAVLSTEVGDAYRALTPDCPQAHWFEREIAEQWPVRPLGHPWLKPIRFQPPRPGRIGSASFPNIGPLTPAPSSAKGEEGVEWAATTAGFPICGETEFYSMGGDEIHEVAVGPVHAGIIEPGHFRFQCHGETIYHLEISLGYQHRGVERGLVESPPRRHLPYIETLAGDTTIGHTIAYCRLVEAVSRTRVPARAQVVRGIALELERVANHIGDLGALAGDVGFLPTQAYCGRIRGDVLNMTALLCGNRFGRGLIRPGGVAYDLDGPMVDDLRRRTAAVQRDARSAVELLWNAPSVMARFDGTGTISRQLCEEIGLVGVAARACGVARDVRSEFPFGIYRFAQIPVSTCPTGDVFARAYVRWLEVQRSLGFLAEQLESLPEGPVREPVAPVPAGEMALSLVEGWRGEICHLAQSGPAGTWASYKVVDPSLHNWFGLAMALRDQQISDFPLCNKSFNLSYCGHDL